jgi:hypothetical protein
MERDRAAELDRQYNNGKMHVIALDASHAHTIQLMYNKAKVLVQADQEHHSMLLQKMRAFVEDPTTWHIKVAHLNAIATREAAHQVLSPPSPKKHKSKELLRVFRIMRNVAQAAHAEAIFTTTRRMSAVMLVEAGAMQKECLGEWSEPDYRKSGYPGQVGYVTGAAIQDAVRWQEHKWPDHDHRQCR